jgi:Domain of unknown function (DUF4365)
MPGPEDSARRAEALAILYLTDRADLRVVREPWPDRGYDLQVTHLKDGADTGRLFGVQVKAVARSTSTEVLNSRLRLQLGRWARFGPPRNPRLPIVVLVYAVDSRQGHWGWLVEPKIDHQRHQLTSKSPPKVATIDDQTLSVLLEQIDRWWSASPS